MDVSQVFDVDSVYSKDVPSEASICHKRRISLLEGECVLKKIDNWRRRWVCALRGEYLL